MRYTHPLIPAEVPMAFCNSCGATLEGGAQFCSKCGAAAAPTPASYPAPPPSKSSSSALKVVLIIVGAVVLIGGLLIVSLEFFAYRIAKTAKVSENGNQVKIETPFGALESNKDPERVAKDLGIDVYPGAQVQGGGLASGTFGGVRTVAASFRSADSYDKVCAFYQSKFPNASVTTSQQDHCTIVSHAPPNLLTISIESDGNGCKFQITAVTKKASAQN